MHLTCSCGAEMIVDDFFHDGTALTADWNRQHAPCLRLPRKKGDNDRPYAIQASTLRRLLAQLTTMPDPPAWANELAIAISMQMKEQE